MVSLIVQMFLLYVGVCLCSADIYNRPASKELEMYRHRSMIVYDRLKAEGCYPPPDTMTRRALVSDRTEAQLEMEKDYYEELTDLLIACRKSKLKLTTMKTKPSTSPTTTKSQTSITPPPATTTTLPTTTTAPPTTTTTLPTTTTIPSTTTSAPSTTTTTTTTPPPTTTLLASSTDVTVVCPLNYILNPVSNSCIRMVTKRSDWDTARADCKASGEDLAVFDTYESVQWLYNFLKDAKTPAEWKMGGMWIGLRASGGVWRWIGRSDAVIQTDDKSWDSGEPDNTRDNDCGCVAYNFNALNDCTCEQKNAYHICEMN